ncbi:MAG: amidohydrolase family protein [Planctomycetes bacterium]|nr:amidohydrolase family protein [Planctomycetota bacterium]
MTRAPSGLVLTGATLVTLDPPAVERADLRLLGERVVARAPRLTPGPGDAVLDLAGKVVLPGLVCAHHHLYSALARGMPPPLYPPHNFTEILDRVWWKLDRALDEEAVYLSALVGVLDAARCGVTTVIDHHASPGYLRGSLALVRSAFEEVGLRGVLCYEVTDRGGPAQRDAGLEENRALLAAPRSPLIRGMVGAHASFTLSAESLRACARLAREFETGVHIHVAEDVCDEEDARRKHGRGVLDRLFAEEVVTARSVLAHGVHLSENDVSLLAACGAWLVHNPRSNMNNAVGYAPVAAAGLKVALGSDGLGADPFEEARAAWLKGRDSGRGPSFGDCLRFLAGGQALAGSIYGMSLNTLAEGAAADLVVLDYPCPTPLTAGNLAGHALFGFATAQVESVIVNGRLVVENRKFRGLDLAATYARARAAAQRVWDRMARM